MGFYFEMELATHLIKAMSAYSWPTVDLTPPTLIRDATSRMSRRKALSAELLNMNEACDALVALQQQLAGIRSYLKQRLRAVTNALAPVSCLPAEVLREIFLTVYMKDPFSNDRLSISRVCSVWRSISLATPHLWATVRATQFARFGDWLSMHAQRSQPLPMDFIMTMGNDEYPSLTGTVKALEEVTLRFASVSFVHRKEHILEGAYAFPYSRYKCQAFPAYPSWAQDIAFSILPKDLENQGSSKYRSHRSALGPYTRSLRITNAVSLWEWGNEEQKLTSLKHVVISGIQMGDVRRVFKDLSLAPALEVLWIAGTEFDEEDFEGLDSEDESDDLAVVRRAKTTPNLGSLQYLAINNCASDLLKFVFGRRFWRTPALTHLTLTFADSEWRMPNVQSFLLHAPLLTQLELRVQQQDLPISAKILQIHENKYPAPALTDLTLHVIPGLPDNVRWNPGTFEGICERWRMVFADRIASSNAKRIERLEIWKGLVLEADTPWFEANVEDFKMLDDSWFFEWFHRSM